MTPASLRQELDALRQQMTAVRQALEQTRQAREASRRENTLLRQKRDALARRFFGKKSAPSNAAPLEWILRGLTEGRVEAVAEEDEPPAISSTRPSRVNPRRVRTLENLEVVREVIELELVPVEPENWKRIGQEGSRPLDYQPGKFFGHETVRPQYGRWTQRQLPPVMAPAPDRVADHSLAAPGLLAQLLVGKYGDHWPYYRQEQLFWQRHGVFMARQQRVPWTAQSVRLLSGITDYLKQELRQGGYVQVDETPVRYQDPLLEGRRGQGYLWTGLVPGQCAV